MPRNLNKICVHEFGFRIASVPHRRVGGKVGSVDPIQREGERGDIEEYR
jgi:hypothetical protein